MVPNRLFSPDPPQIIRVPFAELLERLTVALLKQDFLPENAALCARLFAETTLDGVYSHGVKRFPRFVAMVRSGLVQPNAVPELVAQCGSLERWDGKSAPGNLNAWRSMDRAISIANSSGIGCVALANTNHWMRGGTYGWQAAHAGVIGICWTNTMPNLPPWGGTRPAIGNNPLVLAVPRSGGPVVLDMAMSQFSYGALELYRSRGEDLPVVGGFDSDGNLTRDPAAIEASQRPLPIGFWKGSGLSFILDLIGAILAGGQATCEIADDPVRETAVTQVFVAIGPRANFGRSADELADAAIGFLRSSPPASGARIRYPGEHTLRIREENLARGVPVERSQWEDILSSAKT